MITYRRYERDESVPDLNIIEKIANIYKISTVDLLQSENIILNKDQSGGISNNALIINQLSKKLIKQYKIRLKEKDELIKKLTANLKSN